MSSLSAPAVQSLQVASQQDPENEQLRQRLADVQLLVGEDLVAVESELELAVASGAAPGPQAAAHLVGRGGKRVRPLCLLLGAACFGPIPVAARELAVVAELVHSATLLHDDVIDDGMDRRGVTTARRVWGNAVSVLAGDMLLVTALDRTQQAAPALMPSLIETLRRLVDGEIVQLRGRAELDVSEATYERILRDKTASLFSWAASAGASLGGATAQHQQALTRFGEHLGMAFQLVDDVLDYAGEDTGKTLLADLKEGKLTLPLVLAASSEPQLLAELERIHAGKEALVESIRGAVLASGACEVTRQRARQFTELGVQALAELPRSPARSLLEQVARQLTDRAG